MKGCKFYIDRTVIYFALSFVRVFWLVSNFQFSFKLIVFNIGGGNPAYVLIFKNGQDMLTGVDFASYGFFGIAAIFQVTFPCRLKKASFYFLPTAGYVLV